LFIGITLNGEPWRDSLSRLATEQLGREFRLEGDVRLLVSLKPALLVRDARLLQPRGFAAANDDFARVGELQVKLDLWPLLQGRLRADTLSATDVSLSLVQRDDGSNNWTFGSEATTPAAADKAGDAGGFSASDAAAIDIRRLALKNIRVSYRGDDGKPMQASLDTLEASAPAGGKLALRASGKIEQRLPYALQVDGGSWSDFAAGRPGWPLALTLDFAGGRLSVQGTLRETDSQLRFGLGAPDLAAFGKLLGIPLPNAGAAGVSGALRLRPGRIELSDLSGVLGKSVLGGSMAIDSRGDRPQLRGDLRFATLDLRPFLGQDSEQDPPTDWQALYKSLSNARLDLDAMKEADADLSLSVAQWLSLPGRINNASLKLRLAGGKLDVPIEATVEGVPLKGRIAADASSEVPALRMDFRAQDAEIGGLARMLTGLPGIEGRLGRLQLAIAARGRQGRELMRSLSVETELVNSRLSYGYGGEKSAGKRVGFTIDNLTMDVAGDKPLSGLFKGSLLGKPLQASLAGESLIAAIDKGASPVTLTLQSGNVAGRFAGVIDGMNQRADFSFSLGAGKAGDVAAWLGLRPDSTLPIALAGKLRGTPQKWSLSQLVLQVGDSSAYSDIDQVQTADKSHLSVLVDIASVNLKQLDALFAPSPEVKQGGDKDKRKPSFDIPILPTRLELDDADLRVRARDIHGTQLALGEMGFDGRVRDGYMQSSPFFATVSGTRYEGAVMLDLRSAEPHAQLWLSAAGVDVGLLARQLKLAKNIDASLERLSLYLDTRSSQLSSLMANARLAGEAVGGKFALRDPNTGAQLKAVLDRLTLSAAPGERIALQMAASIDGQPVQATLKSATAKELTDPMRRVPFDLALEASGATLQLSGSMDRDIDARDVELALELRGEKFNRLDKLLRVSLPPWGPWSVAGRFRMSNRGYAVDDMLMKVGTSSLKGRGRMDTNSGRAKLDIDLSAPLIQLDDFKLDGWSALGEGAGKDHGTASAKPATDKGKEAGADAEALRKKALEASDQVQALLSPETLSQADATLSVQVDRVLSGKDRLGQGKLSAKLDHGRAEIGPVVVEMPGGQATLALSYEPRYLKGDNGAQEVQADLKIDIDNFNYGVLGRRFKPDSELDGRFSLKMDVASRAPRLSQMLAHGKGRIDFAVWPKDLRAGVFDLWAVNLLVALLPTVNPKNESTINCAVGRFALNDGKLEQKQLVIDTSRMRVTGTTAIDFGSETVQMRLQPQAKAAQFLSLATPIEVRGNFTDYHIGPKPGDVIETAIRLATSIVWVPIKRLFSEKVPADGRDVCVTTLQ
ncbi:MAG: hypothetical protein RL404_1144, partial [Pseudomonadota bacterium]